METTRKSKIRKTKTRFEEIYQIKPTSLKTFIKFTESRKTTHTKCLFALKVQSCKLHNNKYIIASTQITNNEIFAFIAVLVFVLLSRKVLFITRKDNRNCYKVGSFFKK